jgi:hypothetical protein
MVKTSRSGRVGLHRFQIPLADGFACVNEILAFGAFDTDECRIAQTESAVLPVFARTKSVQSGLRQSDTPGAIRLEPIEAERTNNRR